MLIDALLRPANAQAVTASAATTDYIDLQIARNMGVGEDLYVVVICDVAMTDSGSDSTVAFKLESDNDSAFGSIDASQEVGTFAALSAIGTRLVAKLQPDKINSRYLRGYFTLANGNLTTGSFSVYIVKDIDAYTSYANGYSIT